MRNREEIKFKENLNHCICAVDLTKGTNLYPNAVKEKPEYDGVTSNYYLFQITPVEKNHVGYFSISGVRVENLQTNFINKYLNSNNFC